MSRDGVEANPWCCYQYYYPYFFCFVLYLLWCMSADNDYQFNLVNFVVRLFWKPDSMGYLEEDFHSPLHWVGKYIAVFINQWFFVFCRKSQELYPCGFQVFEEIPVRLKTPCLVSQFSTMRHERPTILTTIVSSVIFLLFNTLQFCGRSRVGSHFLLKNPEKRKSFATPSIRGHSPASFKQEKVHFFTC